MSDTSDIFNPNVSQLTLSVIRPYLAAMKDFFQKEIELMRSDDENRKDLIFRLQGSILSLNNVVISNIDLYLTFKKEIDDVKQVNAQLLSQIETLGTAVTELRERVTELESA